MLIPHTAFDNLDVLSLQTGTQVGLLGAPIIDPSRLKIVAFYCNGPAIDKNSLLHTDDIREYSMQGVIIDAVSDILPFSSDLVRLQEFVAIGFKMLDKLVIDDHGQKLGKVESFAVNSDNFEITQFRVLQGKLKKLGEPSLLIHRQQIIEVTDSNIIVKAPDIRLASSQPSWLSRLLNPSQRQISSNQSQIKH